jgi:hypothetical protein
MTSSLQRPKEKSRLAAGLSFSHLLALTQFSSELAVLLTLLALTALAVRILLLLAGLLAAALLLAGLLTRVLVLLTRVLVLLARVLVLVGHSGSPFFALLGTPRGDNGEGRVWFPENSGSSAIIAWRRLGAIVAAEPGENYPCTAV